MKYTIAPDNSTLTLECTPAEREELRTLQAKCHEAWEHFGTEKQECKFLESLLANSELEWINPADTGDLTDAPMLGILGEEGVAGITVFLENHGYTGDGQDGANSFVRPILHRWAFMPYQVHSFLEDLMKTGKAIFTS